MLPPRRRSTPASPGRCRRHQTMRAALLRRLPKAIWFSLPHLVALFAVLRQGVAFLSAAIARRRGSGRPPAAGRCARCSTRRCAGVARRGGAWHRRAAVPRVAPPICGRRRDHLTVRRRHHWSRASTLWPAPPDYGHSWPSFLWCLTEANRCFG